jgi:hypothetical protein
LEGINPGPGFKGEKPMGKKPVENRSSKTGSPRLKVIRNKPEAVQEMLWKIVLNGQTRIAAGGLRPQDSFGCSEKE